MGIAVLFDFFFQFIYSTARGIQTYFESIFTRYVVDIVCIYSCFSLGQVQYTVPDAYIVERYPEKVMTRTWYTPEYFFALRFLYVWKRWYNALNINPAKRNLIL